MVDGAVGKGLVMASGMAFKALDDLFRVDLRWFGQLSALLFRTDKTIRV